MIYPLASLPLAGLARPAAEATAALVRLDERIAGSSLGTGLLQRLHFAEAHASLWVDGELVHLEDLVLHDAGADIRAPSHELTIARDVLKTRRRIAAQPPDWALSDAGLAGLCRLSGTDETADAAPAAGVAEDLAPADAGDDALTAEFRALDAVLARSQAVLAQTRAEMRQPARNPLVYEPDWNEEERLAEWQRVLAGCVDLPPVLQAVVLLDAWNVMAVSEHAPWLGRLLAAARLRETGVTTGGHLAAINLGLKAIAVDRRRHRDRNTRLAALLQGLQLAAEYGLKDHDRLLLARQMLDRKLAGRRRSSSLPALVDLVLSRPLVTAGMIAGTLDITPQAALRLVSELGLREMTGRGRFRAWGIL